MFFILSKILLFLITPITWIVLLLLVGLIRKKWKYIILAFSVLYLFSNGALFSGALNTWEIPPTPNGEVGKYDIGIVLGGFSGYDLEYDRVIFGKGSDRIMQAYRLYKKGVVKKLLITGGSGRVLDQTHREALVSRDYLMDIGMPKSDILVEFESRNTYENAKLTKELLAKEKLLNNNLLLITSASHMRRALGCFKKVDLDVVGYSTDRKTRDQFYWSPDHILIPDAGILVAWNSLLKELMGYYVYKAKGYI